jgi:hypothetical protein
MTSVLADLRHNHPRAAAPLTALLIHEDAETGLRARHFTKYLSLELEENLQFQSILWHSVFSDHELVAETAERAAQSADIVIVSLKGGLSTSLQEWLTNWVDGNWKRDAALIALFPMKCDPGAVKAHAYLSQAASDAGLEAFTQSVRMEREKEACTLLWVL